MSANWNNITSLTQALSNDLENIEKWSTENKMYINTEKTKALLVTGKWLQHKLSEETATLKLHLDANNIDQLSHHKLLGLIIDYDLSFEAHMDELCKKLSKGLGLLRRISPYLKQRHKSTFHLATITPVMLYLSPIWSPCSKELLPAMSLRLDTLLFIPQGSVELVEVLRCFTGQILKLNSHCYKSFEFKELLLNSDNCITRIIIVYRLPISVKSGLTHAAFL